MFKFIVFLMSLLVCSDAIYGAEERTSFELPKETPGLQYFMKLKNINGADKFCLHVIVPETEANKAFKNKENIDNIMAKDGNIYFPVDGTQPTTEEAAKYSCANVDNTEQSPITEWYMKMFGWPHDGKNQIKAGYAPGNLKALIDATCPILTFNAQGAPDDFENNFWNEFRVIASDPVGRILLYRLLIEIRRQRGGDGECEEKVFEGSFHQQRNNNRSIIIRFEEDKGNFDYKENAIIITMKKRKIHVIKIENDNLTTVPEERSADIGLFHEMLHWFHWLRNPVRQYEETGGWGRTRDYIRSAFYGKSKEITDNNTWETAGVNFNQEEMRTILGAPILQNLDNDNVINGDELSENLYRLSRHVQNKTSSPLALRFGHGPNGINPADKTIWLPLGKDTQRFRLAYDIAINRYKEITGKGVDEDEYWKLLQNTKE